MRTKQLTVVSLKVCLIINHLLGVVGLGVTDVMSQKQNGVNGHIWPGAADKFTTRWGKYYCVFIRHITVASEGVYTRCVVIEEEVVPFALQSLEWRLVSILYNIFRGVGG